MELILLFFLLIIIIIAIITHVYSGGNKYGSIIRIGNMVLSDMPIFNFHQLDMTMPLPDANDFGNHVFKNGKIFTEMTFTENEVNLLFDLVFDNKEQYIYVPIHTMKRIKDLFNYENINIDELNYIAGICYAGISKNILLFGETHKSIDILVAGQQFRFINMFPFYIYNLDRELERSGKTAVLYVEQFINDNLLYKKNNSFNINSLHELKNKLKCIKIQSNEIRSDNLFYRGERYYKYCSNGFLRDILMGNPLTYELQEILDEFFTISPTNNDTKYLEYLKKSGELNVPVISRAAFEINRLKDENIDGYNRLVDYINNISYYFDSWLRFNTYYTDIYTMARILRKPHEYQILYNGSVHTEHFVKLFKKIMDIDFEVYGDAKDHSDVPGLFVPREKIMFQS